uniref:DUF169 domain-containing protein n=1 Tax=Candidatus Methanophaga sp. ANME-1 ERB7 TaxID=2759913 RepID=A0A7G9Z7F2_9EURY|nr:hypothetical protein FDFOPPHA_00011 [Methanosarcinales archaeon ANME-1 ERB7]
MEEEYIENVKTIVDALSVEKEPVGVKYTDEDPRVEIETGNYTVCGAILAASEGKVILLSEDRCACPGGKTHLGLTQRGEIPWKMLVEGEKLWCDVKTAIRSGVEVEKIARPPSGLSTKIFLYPAMKGIFQPDLILMLVNAEQASRLITLNQFWDGKTPSIEMRGSLCWSMITYPLVSGNFNLSVGDISARRMERWDPNIMAASIPWERIRGIAEAVEFSTAGRAKPSKEFERMTEKMKSRR